MTTRTSGREKNPPSLYPATPASPKLRPAGTSRPCSSRGFSVIELLVVMVVGLILTVVAIPQVKSVLAFYKLRSAVESVTAAIQTTRYQSISQGYPYQLAFTASSSSYQKASDPTNSGTFANVGGAVPLEGSPATLGGDTTLVFRPSGVVTATNGTMVMTMAYEGRTGTITVTSYGNVNVKYAP